MTSGWHWHCKVCHAPLVLHTDGSVVCTCLSLGPESETVPAGLGMPCLKNYAELGL